ncbi:hypothetical protein QFC21_000744 [Naganishia friedmannii]|uniref:Uncharacterized protein n=1 Tax=Naganishia friedmannii TaxID=89922 RepID=A0ACC2W7V9_9TREE|nr:hypothetical protein QFC21_000744 [Naganishia friedmannii]
MVETALDATSFDQEDRLDRPFLHSRQDSASSIASIAFIPPTLPAYLARSLSHSDDPTGQTEQRHQLGLTEAIALVVGMQVGSGIFSSPGVIVHSTKSVGSSLIVWLVSGLLAWTGASSFAELGCAIPLNGGAQAYLAYAYSPFVSYLFCWTAVSALKPGSCAIIALIFGEYINRLIATVVTHEDHPLVAEWTIKTASLLFIIVLGLVSLVTKGPGPTFGGEQGMFEGASTEVSSYAIALYSGLWAFDGYDQANYVAGQLKSPAKNLPRVIHISMFTVLTLFLAANISYFIVLPKAIVAQSNTVALDFGTKVLGKAGGVVFSVVVASSAKESFLPKFFTRLSTRNTPDNALALQALLTLFFVVFGGGFRRLVNFFSVASWTFYLLTVSSAAGTPLNSGLILLLMPIVAAPLEAIAAACFIAAGIPAYYLTVRAGRANNDSDGILWRFQHAFREMGEDIRRVFRHGGASSNTAAYERIELDQR